MNARRSAHVLVMMATVFSSGCAARIRAAVVEGSWIERCPGGMPAAARLNFSEKGTFTYAYEEPEVGVAPGKETWSVKGRVLTVSWNDGYAVSRYEVVNLKDKTHEGTSSKNSCPATITLSRPGRRR
jgi:hypothetical protein